MKRTPCIALAAWLVAMSPLCPQRLLLSAPSAVSPQDSPPFRFVDVASTAGLNQATVYGGEQTNKYLLETTGSGAAFIDYDNDGWLDIFLVNGSRLEGFPEGKQPLSLLYRNQGQGRFEDVTAASGVGRHGWGQAVCAGDVDNDGYDDLFVTYWGQNVLWRNQGDGSFAEWTSKAGLTQKRKRWNSGCAFLDYDRDGDLDLFAGNYIDDPDKAPSPESGLCLYKGVPVACGPPGLTGGKNILYQNQGKGTFRDVSEASGIASALGTYALGAVVLDFNDDGWPDIYVANDSNPAALYQNNQDGTFTDMGILAGVAYSQDGKPQAGMGVAAADVNRDGRLDLFKTNFAEDTVNLYLNTDKGIFEDATFRLGLGINTRWLGWGCGLIDFDNDGWVDIFEVNGHVYPEVRQLSDSSSYRQRKVVYRKDGSGRFLDVTSQVGEAVTVPQAGRGAAFGDFDNDGDVDVLVSNVNSLPNLYRTDLSGSNHWIQLRLIGTKSNRSALGARVRLKAGDLVQVDEVRSGGSYYSQSQLRLHFGLGEASKADWIEVRWPNGEVERVEDVAADRLVYIREGAGEVSRRGAEAQSEGEEGILQD